MSDKQLMAEVQRQLSGRLAQYTRRGGYQPLLNHYTAVYTGYRKLTEGDDISDPTWDAAAFLHDAVEDGVVKIDDKRISPKLRAILEILTPQEGEGPEEHFERQLASDYPQVAAILYANCMHNINFSEMEKQYMEDVERLCWYEARKIYLKRASRALVRYTELQYT